MKFTIGTLFLCCFAMERLEEDFHFEPNQLDLDNYVEFPTVKTEKLKSQLKPFKFGLSDAVFSDPPTQLGLMAEKQDSPKNFDCEIEFVENKFEALDASASLFVPKTEDNELEFNVNALSFSPRIMKYRAEQKTPLETAMKNEKLYMYHNIKYENDGRVWRKKEDLDVLFELIADQWNWTYIYRYEAHKRIVEETRLKYSQCRNMLEKKNAILESMKFFDQTKFRKKIFRILQRYCHELHNFDSWNRDVFQTAAAKIGINVENPVAVLLLQNMNNQGSFTDAIRKVYEKSKNLAGALRALQEIAPLSQKDEENIRQHLLKVKPLFLTNYGK